MMGRGLGLAVPASFAAARTSEVGVSSADALVAVNSGYHMAFMVGAVLAAIAALLSATLASRRARARTAKQSQHRAFEQT
jgi:hypothetical protein